MAGPLVDDLDDEMDDLHVSLTVEVVAGTMPLPVAVELALLARFYERFGDHAVNLAKRVAVLARTNLSAATDDAGLSPGAPGHLRADAPGPGRPHPTRSVVGGRQATMPRRTNDSAIWTALSAAPLRRLSPLTNSASAWGAPSATRIRPTRRRVGAGGPARRGEVGPARPRAPRPAA